MAYDSGLVDWVVEALEPLGTVSQRRMMGGATLYLDDTIFALVVGDGLYFKADAESDARWDAAGCARFTYEAKGKVNTFNYRAAPDAVHDDADTMREWALLAVEAGRRAPPPRRKRGPAPKG
ncbi:TfoX/Sxy family protein [Sphingomonas sanxanigenens]|uniref:TfoX N-terminal domain-containing protein n=1 Tax=Sphingomonas sanxanigenens DSM 19645 = NX02 TaxID=1123269 RepID=W0AHJ0_9SPHN|nr:TfoX/Sxy family protein [Sphingomonas sanxanigenens]AHE57379.1 hypothetical protein NX02_29050 [Sphingomonas sanxanigenens DSM 19645 = NX02]